MAGAILVSDWVDERFGEAIRRAAPGRPLAVLRGEKVEGDPAEVEIAFFSGDLYPTRTRDLALALRLAHTTRMFYLLALGIGLWLVSGTSVLVGEQSASRWLESSVFVAAAVILGRTLLGTRQVAPPLDLSLRGIIHNRNSGLLGYRAGRSLF